MFRNKLYVFRIEDLYLLSCIFGRFVVFIVFVLECLLCCSVRVS